MWIIIIIIIMQWDGADHLCFLFFLLLWQVHQGRLKEDQARKCFQQLIDAVDYCHSRGVYHRDLKVCVCVCWPSFSFSFFVCSNLCSSTCSWILLCIEKTKKHQVGKTSFVMFALRCSKCAHFSWFLSVCECGSLMSLSLFFFCFQQPENLLLDSAGNMKISDFGLSALPQQFRVCT